MQNWFARLANNIRGVRPDTAPIQKVNEPPSFQKKRTDDDGKLSNVGPVFHDTKHRASSISSGVYLFK